MGIIERKAKEKVIRGEDIIDAAERVFFEKGFVSTTVDDIAREAEFTKRTIYQYFFSKDQLYFEVMIRGYRLLLSKLEEDLQATDEDAMVRLRQMAKTIYNFSVEHPNYFKAIMSYENGEKDFSLTVLDKSKEECYALGEQLFGYLASTLQTGRDQGKLREDLDVVDTALIIWACMVGIFNTMDIKRHYIENYHHRTYEDMVLKGMEFVLRNLEAKETI